MHATTSLSKRQRQHLERVIFSTAHELEEKYSRGAVEHGDDLLDMTLLRLVEEAIQENLDQRVFLHRMRELLQEQDFQRRMAAK